MGLRNRTQFLDEECFFVTATCHDWLPVFTATAYFRILTDSLIFVAQKYEADYLGYVLMPNHLHLLIYFKKKNQLSNLMRDFKKFTSGEIRRLIEVEGRLELLDKLRFEKREQKFKLWQDRFDDVFIKSREMAATKIEYMHLNPLQAHWNLALRPEDYLYSSASLYESGRKVLCQSYTIWIISEGTFVLCQFETSALLSMLGGNTRQHCNTRQYCKCSGAVR